LLEKNQRLSTIDKVKYALFVDKRWDITVKYRYKIQINATLSGT